MTLKSILAGAAVAALLAGGAQAQTATDPAMPAPAAPGAAAPAEPVMPGATAPATPPAAGLADAHEGYSPVDLATISTDQLTGANIVNHQNETVASIDDVLISDSGQVEGVVAKFGGFLGFGSNLVQLGMDQIEVMKDADGKMVVRTALTPEAIEAMPEYVAPATN